MYNTSGNIYEHLTKIPKFNISNIGVRGSLERDISSLRAFGPGGGQISRVVRVSARALFGVFEEK